MSVKTSSYQMHDLSHAYSVREDANMLKDELANTKSVNNQHYEVPNMSSMLYDYTNKEQERIF